MSNCDECCTRKNQALGVVCAECADKLRDRIAMLTKQLAASEQREREAILESIEAAHRACLKHVDWVNMTDEAASEFDSGVDFSLGITRNVIRARGKAAP